MKRNAAALGLFALLALLISPWLVQAQVPAQRVIIVDPTGTHAASVTGGNLGTAGSASVTVDTISHITSVTHVAVHTIGGVNVGDSSNTALRVNCVTGCSASAGVTGSTHVSVALHVAGTINGARFHIQGLGIPGQAHGGVLTIQGVAGGVAVPVSGSLSVTTDNVNVFHQSTIRHISSVTHVAISSFSREAHLAVAQSGTWNMNAHIQGGSGHVAVTFAGGGHVAITQAASLAVSCSNCTGGSSDAVNVFHQSTVRHISSTTHVAGSVFLTNQTGTAVTVTGTALDVNCTGCAAASSVTVSHIQSVTHVALVAAFGQHVGAAQSGAWTVSAQQASGHHFAVTMPGHVAITQAGSLAVSCSNCTGGSSDAVNVFHQSTIRHISSVTHVYVVDLPRSAHLAAGQSGAWTIQAAHQVVVSHISSITHVGGTGNAGALHISGISNVGSGAPGGTTTPMACHTTVAFSTTADLVLAHSQNSWRIYICAIVLVNASAESVSIVEGTGTTCATSLRGIIGGFGGTMSLAANGGFSAVSPFPIFSSSTNGNQVCLDKSGSGNVSGSISYRAAP